MIFTHEESALRDASGGSEFRPPGRSHLNWALPAFIRKCSRTLLKDILRATSAGCGIFIDSGGARQ